MRDDVEAYINKIYTDERENKAAMQNARVKQAALLVPKGDRNAALKVATVGGNSTHCLFAVFYPPKGGEKPYQRWGYDKFLNS